MGDLGKPIRRRKSILKVFGAILVEYLPSINATHSTLLCFLRECRECLGIGKAALDLIKLPSFAPSESMPQYLVSREIAWEIESLHVTMPLSLVEVTLPPSQPVLGLL